MLTRSDLSSQVQLQSCILAGGVAVGVSVSAVQHPWEAMTIGFTAAVISTAGFHYLKVPPPFPPTWTFAPWSHSRRIKTWLCCRSTCCWHSSATTHVLLWAVTGFRVCWDGSHSSSCRSKTALIPSCKSETAPWCWITACKRWSTLSLAVSLFLAERSGLPYFTSALSSSPSLWVWRWESLQVRTDLHHLQTADQEMTFTVLGSIVELVSIGCNISL